MKAKSQPISRRHNSGMSAESGRSAPPPRISTPSSANIHTDVILQRALISPSSLTRADVLQLQKAMGNQAFGRFWRQIQTGPIQKKPQPLTARQLYQPEIDRLSSVVENLIVPESSPSPVIQRQKGLKKGDPVWALEYATVPVKATVHLVINDSKYLLNIEDTKLLHYPENLTLYREGDDFTFNKAAAKDQIMRILIDAGGFVPLGEVITENTQKAFGLDKAPFMEAFRELDRKDKLVYPSAIGLHFAEDKEDRILRILGEKGGDIEFPDSYGQEHAKVTFGLVKKDFDKALEKLINTHKLVTHSDDHLRLTEKGGTHLSKLHASLKEEKELELDKEKKMDIFMRFNQMMSELGYGIFLSGGAVANLRYGSPREMKDLDYRTTSFAKPFTELGEVVQTINEATQRTFSVSDIKPFVVDEKNTNAIDGEIDGCQVTVARILNPDALEAYETEDFLASGKDLIMDKATSFIFRHSDQKRSTDLFDLLWSMEKEGMAGGLLKTKLDEERGESYKAELESKQSGIGKKTGYYSKELSTQFSISLGDLMKRGLDSLNNLMTAYVKNRDAVRAVTEKLEEVAGVFQVPFLKAAENRFISLIIQAGNMTGDMFGVSAALIHNPLAHVLVISEESERDRSSSLLGFYRDTARDDERIHELKAENAGEETQDMSKLYTLYAGRQKKELPYSAIVPAIPTALQTPDLQYPISSATSQTAAIWDIQKSHRTMKKAFGVNRRNFGLIEAFLDVKGIPRVGNFLALWTRFSGKRGGPHAQHDTSSTGLRQMATIALEEGYKILLVGDKGENAGKLLELVEAGGGNVYDLTEFWKDSAWTERFQDGKRQDQFNFFNYLHEKGKLKHLGFRSGNLEAYALIGHTVRYMEERGNLQAGRMEAWHSSGRTEGEIGYDRIVISDRVPTLTGQWVTNYARWHQTEIKPPWIESPEEFEKEKIMPLPESAKERANLRGFTVYDLQKIRNFLKPREEQTNETWLLELRRKHREYDNRGWELTYDDLDPKIATSLFNYRTDVRDIEPEWMNVLRTESYRAAARNSLASKAMMYGWGQKKFNDEVEVLVEKRLSGDVEETGTERSNYPFYY